MTLIRISGATRVQRLTWRLLDMQLSDEPGMVLRAVPVEGGYLVQAESARGELFELCAEGTRRPRIFKHLDAVAKAVARLGRDRVTVVVRRELRDAGSA